MGKFLTAAALAAMVATPLAVPTAASAQGYDRSAQDYDRSARGYDRSWRGDNDSDWDPSRSYRRGNGSRQLGADDRVYRGSDGRYYCKRSNGTTGLVLGAVGGGVLGNVLGGGTLGTLLGAGGGALLGRSMDRKHDDRQNERNGYRCQ